MSFFFIVVLSVGLVVFEFSYTIDKVVTGSGFEDTVCRQRMDTSGGMNRPFPLFLCAL